MLIDLYYIDLRIIRNVMDYDKKTVTENQFNEWPLTVALILSLIGKMWKADQLCEKNFIYIYI